MKKHCILWTVVITLIVSWFLFFPWSKQVLEDGGTIVYSSFTYKIYIWNSIGGKTLEHCLCVCHRIFSTGESLETAW